MAKESEKESEKGSEDADAEPEPEPPLLPLSEDDSDGLEHGGKSKAGGMRSRPQPASAGDDAGDEHAGGDADGLIWRMDRQLGV